MKEVDGKLTVVEKIRYLKSEREHFVDIHCHCLPAVDDGPATLSESLSLCRALAADCVTDVIATPHQLGRFNDCNEAGQIREQVSALSEHLERNNICLSVVPGGDVRVDERICRLLEADRILTLADGGRYILLEIPHEVFIDIEPLLVELASLGVQAIISHPERHFALAKQPEMLLKWLARGAHLQVTSGSLLGEFGNLARVSAWHFLSSGWASFVATDAHNLYDRKPSMKVAFEQISIKLGHSIARRVCIENPLRVLEGRDIQTICSKDARKCFDEKVPISF
jgi:protein-tyrosine phosphatase